MTSRTLSLRLTFPFTVCPFGRKWGSETCRSLKLADFSDYGSVSHYLRAAAGVKRLSPSQAAIVRSAVTRHNERQAAKSLPVRPAGSRTTPEIRAQLDAQRKSEITSSLPRLGSLYRVYESDVVLELTSWPGCQVRTSTKWVSGRGGFGHVTDGQTTTLKVSPQWVRDVEHRGLAAVDGLLTTHAALIQQSEGFEVFQATWIRQGRGYELYAESGLIARHTASGTTYHSPHSDPKKAVAGLKRKLTAQGVPTSVRDERRRQQAQARAERQACALAKLVDRVSRWDLADIEHVEVTRQDSLRAGNCVPGTDDFIDRYGFDGRESATIGEIATAVGLRGISGLSEKDLTQARQLAAACLVAIRRDKQVRRLVLA